VIVETLTDNRNRTASDVRAAFSKHGGALGETNSVAFMFTRLGVVRYAAAAASEDDMLEAAIEAGADNVETTADGHEITSTVENFLGVRDALEKRFDAPESARFEWRPATTVTLDEDAARSLLKMLDALDELDDVQNVFANFELPEEIAQRLAA
jgi:YebC/PmpR family DNA-binding regulatory protein